MRQETLQRLVNFVTGSRHLPDGWVVGDVVALLDDVREQVGQSVSRQVNQQASQQSSSLAKQPIDESVDKRRDLPSVNHLDSQPVSHRQIDSLAVGSPEYLTSK